MFAKSHLFVFVWVILVGAGVHFMGRYSLTPGTAANPPQNWPEVDELPVRLESATLVMFAHPRCPCTRASVGELARIMSRCQDLVSAYVVFMRYDGTSEDWARTDLWEQAASIPGVQVIADEAGQLARQFAVSTSGDTVVYGTNGRLIFHGGVTPSRGHFGDNAGHSAIVSLLTRGVSKETQTAVFGCPLWNGLELPEETK